MLSMKHIVFDCDGTLVDTRGFRPHLFPGIKELLEQLALEAQLYVWTARGQLSTHRMLKALGIFEHFSDFSTPDFSPPKPHAGGLAQMLDEAVKSDIFVIGDSSNDMLGAKAFGVCAIGAIWNGESNGEYLREAGADFIVSHPSECSKLIRLNLKGSQDV
jgi:phosphoglycolate phosphatase